MGWDFDGSDFWWRSRLRLAACRWVVTSSSLNGLRKILKHPCNPIPSHAIVWWSRQSDSKRRPAELQKQASHCSTGPACGRVQELPLLPLFRRRALGLDDHGTANNHGRNHRPEVRPGHLLEFRRGIRHPSRLSVWSGRWHGNPVILVDSSSKSVTRVTLVRTISIIFQGWHAWCLSKDVATPKAVRLRCPGVNGFSLGMISRAASFLEPRIL
jgi:hypothetical protein